MFALAWQGVLSFSQHCFNKDPGERSSQASGTRETDNMQREFKMNSNTKESRNLQCGRNQISPPSVCPSLLSVFHTCNRESIIYGVSIMSTHKFVLIQGCIYSEVFLSGGIMNGAPRDAKYKGN